MQFVFSVTYNSVTVTSKVTPYTALLAITSFGIMANKLNFTRAKSGEFFSLFLPQAY